MRSFLSPRFSPVFSLGVFRAAPQLTERLEEARLIKTPGFCSRVIVLQGAYFITKILARPVLQDNKLY